VVVWRLAFTLDVSEKNLAGHADLFETSIMMYLEKEVFGGQKVVDLSSLPPRKVPIRYPDFSVVDGPGFSEHPSPGRVVQTDPRDASVDKGKQVFNDTVQAFVDLARKTLQEKGL
jgi:creatinine amidohydrolase/Fe(II)-dependent formamide hydrolase-like protein